MMGFQWWFAALAVLAALFVAWPMLAKRGRGDSEVGDELKERVQVNDALYAEQARDLEAQWESGELSDGQYRKLKQELDNLHTQDNAIDAVTSSRRRLAHAGWVVAVIALLIPAIAYFMYTDMGASPDWQIQQLNNRLVRQQQRGASAEQTQALSEELHRKLEQRLEDEPDNLNNRFLLARTSVDLGDFRQAIENYRYILERQPNSPQVTGELAQVLFLAAGNRFTPEVQQVFDRALALDPENGELLGFAGIAAYQSGQFQRAIDYWQRGLKALESSDPRYATWQNAIAQARSQLAASGAEPADTEAAEEVAQNALQVSVQLGQGVDADPGDSVFIYARAWQGAKMPLAVQQVKVADLPVTVQLDDSMSMVPGMTISRFPELEVVARISSSGVADARSGDWQATAGPVKPSASEEAINLVIDSQIP